MRCKNDGQCVPTCDNSPEDGFFSCLCSEEWEGEICAVKVFIFNLYFLPKLFHSFSTEFRFYDVVLLLES